MDIFNYNLFLISESKITLSDNLKNKLDTISRLLEPSDKKWIDSIISQSGKDIESKKLNKDSHYLFDLSEDPKYVNIEYKKDQNNISQPFKIGRSLKLMVPEIPNDTLSRISSAFQRDLTDEIIVVQGEKIEYYYNYNDISTDGTIGNSCMNNLDIDGLFDLYTKNVDSVKLAILLKDNLLVARALIWKTEMGWIMDRVYYSSDKYEYKFKEWAMSKSYMDVTKDHLDLIVHLKESKFEKYPYLDTFKYISINDKMLSNVDSFSESDEVGYLSDTNGEINPLRNLRVRFELPIDYLGDWRVVHNLHKFIELSIDNEKWLDDYKSDEKNNYYLYPCEFLDVHDYLIKSNFNELELWEISEEITKENFIENIKELSHNEPYKYEEIVNRVIDFYVDDRYKGWVDFHDEIDGTKLTRIDHIGDINMSRYLNNLINTYCSIEKFEKNLKEIYDRDINEYIEIIRNFY